VNGYDECKTYVEHLRIEHSHIDRSLEELQHLFGEAAHEKTRILLAEELLAKLLQLREQLTHHFREEEEGGCLEEAQSRSPSLSEDVRELQGQHAGFLQTLDGLIAEAQTLVARPNELEKLRGSFGSFLQQLHTHESEENRILLFGFGSPAMETLS